MTEDNDIVKRLKDVVPYQGKSNVAFLCHEAANEITRLRAELDVLTQDVDDEADVYERQRERAVHWKEVAKERANELTAYRRRVVEVSGPVANVYSSELRIIQSSGFTPSDENPHNGLAIVLWRPDWTFINAPEPSLADFHAIAALHNDTTRSLEP